jgi:catechol 2,3-dioxygenase-like lactoylglutathione lyase family enzyme
MPPTLVQTVLDASDVRQLAEFYRQLLGWRYREGDDEGDKDWLVLRGPVGQRLAFQFTERLPRSTWPDPEVPQQLHLDIRVATKDELDAEHDHVLALGARLILDRSDDEEEPVRVYADPAGHPFCLVVQP